MNMQFENGRFPLQVKELHLIDFGVLCTTEWINALKQKLEYLKFENYKCRVHLSGEFKALKSLVIDGLDYVNLEDDVSFPALKTLHLVGKIREKFPWKSVPLLSSLIIDVIDAGIMSILPTFHYLKHLLVKTPTDSKYSDKIISLKLITAQVRFK